MAAAAAGARLNAPGAFTHIEALADSFAVAPVGPQPLPGGTWSALRA